MKVLAAHDGGSGCAWYRVKVPLMAAANAGAIDVRFYAANTDGGNDTGDPYLTGPEQAEGADIFVGQRVNAYDGLDAWRRLMTPQRRTVYENDDDIWNITPENPAHAFFGEEILDAVQQYCDFANLVTVTSEYLADRHRELSPGTPVTVLPNYIPGWVLDLPTDDREGHPRVGWIGGASHIRDLQVTGSSVRRFMERFPDWHAFCNGVDFRRTLKLRGDRTFHIPWLPVCSRPKLYYRSVDFDIGIAPLLDTEFSRSKSPVKALEYFARGIPVIASDVGPYREFVKHGETGFLVKYEHEWLKYLSILASDEELRLKMGAAAKEQAREHTIEKNWHKWVDAYSKLFPEDWKFQE